MKIKINITKKEVWKYTRLYGALIVLAFVRALGTYVFIISNGFAPGGVSGVASILYNVILPFNERLAEGWFNPAVTVFVLNAPLLVVSFKLLDKNFAINTFICVVAFSLFMGLFSLVDFPQFLGNEYSSTIVLLAAIAGGVILGLCLGLMLRLNASMGGTDIIGKVLYKKNPIMNVQWLIFMLDCVVALASGVLGLLGLDMKNTSGSDILVAILTPVFYSYISLFSCSKVADVVQAGFEGSLVFNIITEKPEELSSAIIEKVHRGATLIHSEGMYTHSEKELLVCVVRKKQISNMKKLIKSIDPNAFLYITNAREVTGKGFTQNLDGSNKEEIE